MQYPKEELLHHIWQHRLFQTQDLTTTDGRPLELIRPGRLNTDAGPDFRDARIKTDGTEWAGNVEIHVRASDWLLHRHQNDDAFSNIILHVVFDDDLRTSLGHFPTLEMKGLISDQVLRRYQRLSNSADELPCGPSFMEVPEPVRSIWLDSLLIGRLQRKSEWMERVVEQSAGDLEQAFMAVLFRAFGMKVNAEPFELLARNTPWKVLSKHQDNLFQLEAVLFGNAGFLESPKDDHQYRLKAEYDFLKHKYDLQPIDPKLWKFLRLRPANFPTLRIAQLAALFQRTGAFLNWFSRPQMHLELEALRVTPSDYWRTHYSFGVETKRSAKQIGAAMAQQLVINSVVPFLFVTAQREARPELRDRSLAILQQLKPEQNSKVQCFERSGMRPTNAGETQALIELKTNYCDHKKCLICSIGANILKRDQ